MTESDSVRSAGCSRGLLACFFLAVVGAFALGPRVQARQRPLPSTPTFRSGVNLITVDVVVRDKRTGRLVTGLTRRDFEINDEGKPQKIATFTPVDLPETRTVVASDSAAPPARDHIATNQRAEGRLIVFFVSDATIPPEATAYLRDWLHRYIHGHMADNDEVLFWPVTDMVPRQVFTNDRVRLDAMVDRIQGTRGELPWIPSIDETLDVLDHLIERFSAIDQRRKVLIFFGGLGAPSNGQAALDVLIDPLYKQVVKDAAAANVAVYPVSVTGVGGLDDVVSGRPPAIRPLPIPLQYLAKETGGFLADRNDFDNVLQEIEDEAGTYYLLGFTPSATDSKPDDFRRLKVTVRRRDVVVRARRGYVQIPSVNGFELNEAATPIEGIASGPVPETAMPLRMQVSCFRGGTGGDTVLITARSMAPEASVAGRTVEYAMVGLDDHARIEDETDGASVIPGASAGLLPGISAIGVLHLKPGLATVKAALRTDTGLTGSVFLDIDVPKLNVPLALSDVELTTVPAHLLVLGQPPAFLTGHLPAPPTTARTFSAEDTMAIYGEVYGRAARRTITATVNIRRTDGRLVRREELPLKSAGSDPGSDRLSYSIRVPLRGLATGSYILQVTASDGADRSADRAIAFTLKGDVG